MCLEHDSCSHSSNLLNQGMASSSEVAVWCYFEITASQEAYRKASFGYSTNVYEGISTVFDKITMFL